MAVRHIKELWADGCCRFRIPGVARINASTAVSGCLHKLPQPLRPRREPGPEPIGPSRAGHQDRRFGGHLAEIRRWSSARSGWVVRGRLPERRRCTYDDEASGIELSPLRVAMRFRQPYPGNKAMIRGLCGSPGCPGPCRRPARNWR
jgi:hypothetical protein